MNNSDETPRQYPFDDGVMYYNYNAHRYVLTESGVKTELGEDLALILNTMADANPSTLAGRFLNNISRTVYMYIYRDTWNEEYLEFLLATYPPLRDMVREMLQAQVEYTLMNGELGLHSGVNVAKGQAMDINALRGRARVAPEVEDLALRTIPDLGFCLKYAGALPSVPSELYRRGY